MPTIQRRGTSWSTRITLPPDPITGKRHQRRLTGPTKRAVQDPVVFAGKIESVAKDRVGIRQAQGRFKAEASRVARVLCRIRIADEQLGRNASPVGTGATERAAFDQRDLHAGGTAVDGG